MSKETDAQWLVDVIDEKATSLWDDALSNNYQCYDAFEKTHCPFANVDYLGGVHSCSSDTYEGCPYVVDVLNLLINKLKS